MLFCVTRAILWLLVQEIQTGKIYAIYIASYNNDTHCKLILNFHDPWPCAYKYRYKHKQVLIDTILVMKFTMDRFCSIRRRDYEHRYIKPCFLVLGLDFYHFNRSSSFFLPRITWNLYLLSLNPSQARLFEEFGLKLAFCVFWLILMVGNPSSEL